MLRYGYNQDEICHATSNSFYGSSVQTKDVITSDKSPWIVLFGETIILW